jgi:hypothetical protein
MRRDTGRGLEPVGAIMGRDASLKVAEKASSSPVATRDWEAAVGSRIAARARPVRLERGVLHVRTASSTWAQELTLLADAIVAQLRGRGIEVEALRFRVGNVDPPERPPWRKEVRTSPPEVPLPPEVRRELAAITDPELRAAIAKAASKNLGWQKDVATAKREMEAERRPRRPNDRALTPAPANKAPARVDPRAAREPRDTREPREAREPREPATSARGAAPAPRGAASKSAPSGRTRTTPDGARRGSPGGR